MSERPFVHLHCHTDYSLLDGACDIKKLMGIAQQQKMPAIAMTDHGNLFGARRVLQRSQRPRRSSGNRLRGLCFPAGTQNPGPIRTAITIWFCSAENQEGYKNLINLVSTGYLDGFYYKPRIDKDLLAPHSKGLIAMSRLPARRHQ